MRLENSELRAFRAVVEEGGFKRAAQSLHISQSAVSQAVAGLESKLEAPLIQRGKELHLSDIGKRLFEHAVDVLREEQQVLERLLSYGPDHPAAAADGVSIVVVPRPGTISPWSSSPPAATVPPPVPKPPAMTFRNLRFIARHMM